MNRLKNIFYAAALVLVCASAPSCSKTRIIPDDKLAEIFHDAFLTNAYTQNRSIDLDSLNIYEPIFEKYGYTSEDVQFTIGNFAKRKSARLSDVVDTAIDMLEAENRFYRRRVAIYDTVGLIARERYAATVYSDTLISIRKVSDTSKLRIVIPVDLPATYNISYNYIVDSSDHNHNLRIDQYLLDDRNRQSGNNTRRLKRYERDKVNLTFEAKENHRKIVLNLNGYPKDMTRPHLTVDSLVVKRFLPDRMARDSMAKSFFDYRTLDSLANPLWNIAPGDSIFYIALPEPR